jgi:hypothetical protein
VRAGEGVYRQMLVQFQLDQVQVTKEYQKLVAEKEGQVGPRPRRGGPGRESLGSIGCDRWGEALGGWSCRRFHPPIGGAVERHVRG